MRETSLSTGLCGGVRLLSYGNTIRAGGSLVRIVGRLLGWLIFLAGLIIVGRDLLAWLDTGAFHAIAIGELWFKLHPTSLEIFQPAVQRHIHPALWDWVIQPVLLWAAGLSALGLAFALITLCRGRDDRVHA